MIKKSVGMLLLMVIAASLLACAGQAEVSPGPTLVITPASAVGGTNLTILGTGFQPGEKVQVRVNIMDVQIALGREGSEGVVVAECNAEGAFMIPSRVPNEKVAPAGVYVVKAVGDQGSTAIFPLGVEEPAE
jgi:hypothetical protein